MKTLMGRKFIVFLLIALLCSGVYILVLKDKCNYLHSDKMLLSIELSGHVYVHYLNEYKMDYGEYPDSHEELMSIWQSKSFPCDWYYIKDEESDSFELGTTYKDSDGDTFSGSYVPDRKAFYWIHVSNL